MSEKREEQPLVGDDGKFMTGKKGVIVTGDGSKTLAALAAEAEPGNPGAGYWLVNKIAASESAIPKGLKVGELYPTLGTEVLAVGDEVQKLNLTEVADCTGWNMSVTQSEIDVTRLKDKFKKYRLGKKDASGTCNSIMTLGVSDEPEGMIGRSMKLFRREFVNGQPKITVSEEANKSLYFIGWLRMTETPGETQAFVFGQIYLYNVNLGGSTGNAQSYDSSMRLTGIDPIFYSLDLPETE